ASEMFQQVIAMKPKSKQASNAATRISDALAFRAEAKESKEDYAQALKDYVSLRDTAKAFEAQKGLGNKKFKKDMYDYYETASAKVIETRFNGSSKGDADKLSAADAYLEFIIEFPKSKNAPVVLNIAAIYYFNTNEVKKSMESRHLMIEQYSTSKYYLEHLAKLGFNYAAIANYRVAAEWYERLYKEAPDYTDGDGNTVAKEAIRRAGIFREKLGDWEQAVKNKKEFMKTYSDDPISIKMPIDIARIYQDNEQPKKAIKAYSDYYTNPPKGASKYDLFYARQQHGLLLKQQGQKKQLAKVWKRTLEAYTKYIKDKDKNKPSKEEIDAITKIIAEIKYDLAQPAANRYLNMKITGTTSTNVKKIQRILNKQIKDKLETKKEVEKLYTEIAFELEGGKWSLAALVEIGKLYDNYAETIENSYVPSFFDEGQAELYKMQLQDQAYNYKQNGIKFYEKAIELAFEFSIYTEATEYAMDRLGKVLPDQYSAREEDVIPPGYLSSTQRTRSLIQTAE
ncbi:MAG: hypothetical protein VX278_13880, partial [Myxococcota bacterium]|nr:hypothetical protein [Myxococcota bacterium]